MPRTGLCYAKRMNDDELIIFDGRQSETAAGVQRGVGRMLSAVGFSALPEFPLVSGRRADIIAINDKGVIWIVEIKSSVADYRADNKWPEYWDFCDELFFAVPPELPQDILPDDTGLIVADPYGAGNPAATRDPVAGGGPAQGRYTAICTRCGTAPASGIRSESCRTDWRLDQHDF